jgi:ABC-type multidrug transport system fused ATPase/permease subunit
VNSFIRLLRYAKPYRVRLAWAVLAMTIYAAASALVIYLIRDILDELVEIVPGANLGKVLWRHGDGSYALIGYFALRNDPIE